MLDYPKLDLELKKGGRVRKLKQKQKQTQRQIVNVNIGNKGVKKSYARRPQQQQQRNMMYYPPPMTTIIQNPNQPQQLPDMMTLLALLNSQGMKTPQQKTINELRLENLEKENLNKTTKEQVKNLNEEKKPFTPEEEEEYYNNFLDDDFRNVNIMNAPIGNPLADDNKLPSLSLNSDYISPPPIQPLREVQITKTRLSKKKLPELIKIAIDNNLYNFTTKGKQGVSMGGKTIRQMTAKELRKIIYDANLPDSKIYN